MTRAGKVNALIPLLPVRVCKHKPAFSVSIPCSQNYMQICTTSKAQYSKKEKRRIICDLQGHSIICTMMQDLHQNPRGNLRLAAFTSIDFASDFTFYIFSRSKHHYGHWVNAPIRCLVIMQPRITTISVLLRNVTPQLNGHERQEVAK